MNRRVEHKDREAIKQQFLKFYEREKKLELIIIINENSRFQDQEQQREIKCIKENIGGYGIRWTFLIRRKEW